MRYIDINDSEDVLRAVRAHRSGGAARYCPPHARRARLAALQIARAVRHHKGKVTVFVPHYAMSGGTLIALAADEIVLSRHAVLGPVDPQVGQYPAASLLKVVSKKPIAEVDDETLILADVGEKAIRQLQDGLKELLARSLPPEKAEELGSLLSAGTWTHDYPITLEEAQRLGLKVRSDMPPDVFDPHEPVPAAGAAATVGRVPARTAPGGGSQAAGCAWIAITQAKAVPSVDHESRALPARGRGWTEGDAMAERSPGGSASCRRQSPASEAAAANLGRTHAGDAHGCAVFT